MKNVNNIEFTFKVTNSYTGIQCHNDGFLYAYSKPTSLKINKLSKTIPKL